MLVIREYRRAPPLVVMCITDATPQEAARCIADFIPVVNS